jgi:hypothetical protein
MHVTKIGPEDKKRILQAIAAGDDSSGMQRLVEEFVKDEPGARILYSKGDGSVSLLLPVRDEYEKLEAVQFSPSGNKTNVLHEATRSKQTVDIEGVGRFYEFIFQPFEFRREALEQADPHDQRPTIALRGEGPLGDWAPMGSKSTFFFDFIDVIAHLAAEGGVWVEPHAEEAKLPRGRGWKPVTPGIAFPEEKEVSQPLSPPQRVLETVQGADEVSAGAGKGIATVIEEVTADELLRAGKGVAWPGEWYLKALDQNLDRFEANADRISLSNADVGVELLFSERQGVRSWQVVSGGDALYLAEADPRAIDRLLALLTPFSALAAEHPTLAEMRLELDQQRGGIVEKAMEDLAALRDRKSAVRDAALEQDQAAFKRRRTKNV